MRSQESDTTLRLINSLKKSFSKKSKSCLHTNEMFNNYKCLPGLSVISLFSDSTVKQECTRSQKLANFNPQVDLRVDLNNLAVNPLNDCL